MKLWRKIKDENGQSRLLEVREISQIDASKPIVLIFPGSEGRNGNPVCHTRAAGAVKCVQSILGLNKENPDVETLVVTYDDSTSHAKRLKMNVKQDKHRDRDAGELVEKFVKPLSDKGVNLTFFGLSYGSVFADAVRAEFIRKCRAEDKSDDQIQDRLENIYIVMAANISRAVSPNPPRRDNRLDYSGVFFSFANDLTARVDSPGFKNSVPKNHSTGKITIAPLSGNRKHIISDAPLEMSGWRQTENMLELQTIRNKSRIPGLRTNHVVQFFLMEGVPTGLQPLLARCLHNAVYRQEKLAVDDVLRQEPVKNNIAQHSAALLPPVATRLVMGANIATWQDYVSRGRDSKLLQRD